MLHLSVGPAVSRLCVDVQQMNQQPLWASACCVRGLEYLLLDLDGIECYPDLAGVAAGI